jgi:hypothetical protein
MNKHKILIGFIFVIAGMIVGATFVTATSYFQLAIGILLYSLLAVFFFMAFPRGATMVPSENQVTAAWFQGGSGRNIRTAAEENSGIDVDKRAFLKLIGGAGLAFFLFSVFKNKIEGLFFNKNLPAPTVSNGTVTNGNDMDQNQLMEGYSISEIDDNIIAFYGFTNHDGAWFIMREDSDTGSFRYARGDLNFPLAWTNRTKIRYDYYSSVFKSN